MSRSEMIPLDTPCAVCQKPIGDMFWALLGTCAFSIKKTLLLIDQDKGDAIVACSKECLERLIRRKLS